MFLMGDRKRLGLVRRGCGKPEESWKNFGLVLRMKTVVCSPITLLANTVELTICKQGFHIELEKQENTGN